MRRAYWLFLTTALLTRGLVWADDGWQKAFTFPLASNESFAGRGVTFVDPADGFTYAYFGVQTADGAQIWRSSDAVDWYQANVNGFGSQSSQPLYSGVAWLSSFTVAGIPYLYVGVTPDDTLGDGFAILRSSGGSSTSQWSVVLSSVIVGNVATDPGAGPGVPFSGAFYFGTHNSDTGIDIWKSTSADGLSSWFTDDAGAGGPGFGEGQAQNPETSYLKVFGSELYVATGCQGTGSPCGQIWKSTGTLVAIGTDTWTQVLVATNTFDAHTTAVTALESFGGYLYAGTMNTAGHAQLWRTSTPDTGGWSAVASPDGGNGVCANCFAAVGSMAIFSLRAVGSYLYAGTWDSGTGLVVYRTADGATWTRSNTSAGFGSTNNQYLGDFVQLGTNVVGDTLNSSGGALWSVLLPGSPEQPGTPSATTIGQTSITWNWSASANAASYSVYESSSPGTVIASTAAAPFTLLDLSTNTQYGIVVAGVNSVGTGTFSAADIVYTLAAPPTSFALVSVYSSSITVSWATNGNPASTNYALEYWLTGGSTTTVTTTGTSHTLTGLLDAATYFVTVNALNGSNVAADSGIILSTFTISVPSLATTVNPVGATILFNTPSGVAELAIPSGAFNQTVTVTVSTTVAADFPLAPAPAAQLTATNVGLQVAVSPAVEPSRAVTIVVPFTSTQMLGYDTSLLQVARFDTIDNDWVPLSSQVNASAGQITALTDHLSLFQIMQSTAGSSVSSAKAFPNPMRPALGESYMTFSELPAGARVRVYTLTGVLVKDLTADATGTVYWDATNDAGVPVASGVYFVYAQAGGQHDTFKVAIQR